ncbi:MAG TPA: hypothetical protein VMR59_03280 [Patescibacteria group bacterium]|jgi:hypothetical protein|nr:hypothetical protein [Patescibacteria group bacterium]
MGWPERLGKGKNRDDTSNAESARVLRKEPFPLLPGTTVDVIVAYGPDPKHLKYMPLRSVVLEERRVVTEINPSVEELKDGFSFYRLEPGEEVVVNRNDPKQLEMERGIAAQGFIQGYGELRKLTDAAPVGTVTRGNVEELHFAVPTPPVS